MFVYLVMADLREDIATDFHLPNEQSIALVRTFVLANHLEALYEKLCAEYGLTRAQSSVLHILHGVYPKHASVVFIKERILVAKSDVSRLIQRLRNTGFVEYSVDEADRRAVKVMITQKGLDAVNDFYRRSNDFLGPFTTLTEEETKQLNSTFLKLLKGFTS